MRLIPIRRMGIDFPDFLRLQTEIISAYWEMGIETTLSCTPYTIRMRPQTGLAVGLNQTRFALQIHTRTLSQIGNRAYRFVTALTGWAPMWGLHLEGNRVPNLHVNVNCELHSETDFSILGDWIGSQIQPAGIFPSDPCRLSPGSERASPSKSARH